MLLRSLTRHIKDQNWFAVWLDLVIVIVGVFIGIQVANWNETRAFNARELELLEELKSEIGDGIELSYNRSSNDEQAGILFFGGAQVSDYALYRPQQMSAVGRTESFASFGI